MRVSQLAKRLNAAVDDWLTTPEANAAGRLGLFRILFSLFYLWHRSAYFTAELSGLPADHRSRVLLIEWLPQHLPPVFFELLESFLVGMLVMLMIGFRVRLATAGVLIFGGVFEACYASFAHERGAVLLTFYIPFFMLLNGRWGHTYSLDALLQQRASGSGVSPRDASWPYFLPSHAVLIVLSVLFLSAAALKVVAGGTWLERPDLMANILLEQNVKAALYELPLNPLAPFISEIPIVYNALRYQTILFEGLFFLSLFNRKVRSLFLALALVFHSINALWLVITFTPLLIVYGLFIDWQALRERSWPKRVALFDTVPSRLLIGATVILAVTAGVLWNLGGGLRAALNLGGLLDWRTIWYPVLPLSLAWCLIALIDLVRSIPRVFSVLYFRVTRAPF